MWLKKVIEWSQKKIRISFGRCPYCNKELLKGMGGSSFLSLNGLKLCPDKHYAEEMHLSGAILVHDNGGEKLPVKFHGSDN